MELTLIILNICMVFGDILYFLLIINCDIKTLSFPTIQFTKIPPRRGLNYLFNHFHYK